MPSASKASTRRKLEDSSSRTKFSTLIQETSDSGLIRKMKEGVLEHQTTRGPTWVHNCNGRLPLGFCKIKAMTTRRERPPSAIKTSTKPLGGGPKSESVRTLRSSCGSSFPESLSMGPPCKKLGAAIASTYNYRQLQQQVRCLMSLRDESFLSSKVKKSVNYGH